MARKGKDGIDNLAGVLVLVQIDGLEKIMLRASKLLASLQELGNVLHLIYNGQRVVGPKKGDEKDETLDVGCQLIANLCDPEWML